MDDIAVLHDVVLALKPQFAGLPGPLFTFARNEIIIGNDLGPDETTLEIGMDNGGGLRCGRTDSHRPGPDLFYPGGEVGLQMQQLVAGANHPVQSGLLQSHLGQELGLVLVFELGKLRLDRRTHGHDLGPFRLCMGAHRVQVGVVLEAVIVDIGDVKRALDGQQVQITQFEQLVRR